MMDRYLASKGFLHGEPTIEELRVMQSQTVRWGQDAVPPEKIEVEGE